MYRQSFSAMLTLLVVVLGSTQSVADTDAPALPVKIPVLIVKYLPVKGDRIDLAVTGDWGASLEETRQKTDKQTNALIHALQEGSRYHGYRDVEARPSLAYEVVNEIEFLEPMPTIPHPGHRVPFTGYKKIVERVDIKKWVEERGVKEVWIRLGVLFSSPMATAMYEGLGFRRYGTGYCYLWSPEDRAEKIYH